MKFRMNGFTLVELMITIVVVSIGVALAVPSWENVVQKRQLTSAAEAVASFVAFSQSEAIKRNELVTVTIQKNGSGTEWCVGAINEEQMEANGETHCHCNETDVTHDKYCQIDGVNTVVNQGGFQKFKMDSSTEGGTDDDHYYFSFDPVRGIRLDENGLVNADMQEVTMITDNTHYKLQVDVSVTGRVRVCNPDGTKKVSGYDDCTAGLTPAP